MSEPGGPSTSEPPLPSKPETTTDIPIWVVGVALLLVMALAGGFVVALKHSGHDSAEPVRVGATSSAGSKYPAEWSRRIAPFALIAEKQYGLDFRHPVPVRFLSPAKFKKRVTAYALKFNRGDRLELKQLTGLLRAFGLIGGGVDLYQAIHDFTGGGTLAYYSFARKQISVRGSKITPAVRSTLVHELTHALQDQHFQVGRRLKKLGKEAKTGLSTGAASVLDAMVEGDAERVQALYRDSLTARKRAALDASEKAERRQARKRIARVPPVVVTMMTSPYTLGQALMEAVSADGDAAIRRLFRHAPTHETVLLDPFRVLSGATGATRVSVPSLHPGEKRFDSGELGVLTWYFMLAERLPLREALAAADGWGGDSYVAFQRNGTSCARLSYAGRTPDDTNRMYSALRRWVAVAPNSAATVSRLGTLVRFGSCDPGDAARVEHDTSRAALQLVVTRTYLALGIARSGTPEAKARCVAGRLVNALPVAELVDPTFGRGDPAAQSRIQQIAAGCR